ncbi:MAG: hypothetical protein MUC47_07585 [Candidatus Kapabacteria bacterium]|jgi:photosystem II stability/assembly factor-like uncharacterized protein|nr:hypothetical protein [Candidatus Kapabacteria bacterium]
MIRTSTLFFGVIALFVCMSCPLWGQDWQSVISNRSTYAIGVNPLNPRTIYVGNIARTVFKSTDGGTLWDELAVGQVGGSSLITLLEVHPRDTNIVFAGGTSFTGLDRSTDGGATWENVIAPSDGSRQEFQGGGLAFHPRNSDTILALSVSPPNVYRSVDRGRTWDSITSLPRLAPTETARAITYAPDSAHIVLAAGRPARLYRSTDGGRTFAHAATLAPHPDSDIAHFRWSPNTAGTVYATVQWSFPPNKPNGGLWKSEDYGLSWTNIAFVDTSLHALAVLPGDGTADEIFVGGGIYFPAPQDIVGDSVVARSRDGGQTWTHFSDIPWSDNEVGLKSANIFDIEYVSLPGGPLMLMSSDAGLFRSTSVTSVPVVGRSSLDVGTARAVGSTLHVQLQQAGACTIRIVDVLGAVVYEYTSTTPSTLHGVPLDALIGGLYVAQCATELGTFTSLFLR